MKTLLLAFTLRAIASLSHGDHAVLADSIATVVAEAETPLFADDVARERTASLMVAVAWRESSFKLDALGDKGRSVCWYQVLGGSRALLTDALACVRRGFAMLRDSARVCPAFPVAPFARGTCDSAEGRAISRDRTWLARWIYARAIEGAG